MRACNPVIERREVGHAGVILCVDRRHRRGADPRTGGGRLRRTIAFGHHFRIARNRSIRRGGIAGDETDAFQKRIETVMLQKFGQRRFGDCTKLHVLDRDRQRAIFLQRYQHFRQPRLVGMFDQIVAHFGWLHVGRSGEHTFQIAKFLNELGRGLRADTRHTRNIVDAVPHQRKDIANLLRPDAEFLDHLLGADALVFHRVEHIDARLDELHQVLVRRHDGHMPTRTTRRLGIACDHIVGLDIILLDHRQGKRTRGIADHRKLGTQILWRFGPMRLVQIVNLVAKRLRAFVEHDCHMRRTVGLVQVIGKLPQHRGITINRAHRLAANVGQGRQSVISAEDVRGTIDEVEMLLFGHECRLAAPPT